MTDKKKGNESLVLQNLSKIFPQRGNNQQEVRAVDDVSLTIHAGEFVTLLGPSGCGKTTTLRLIAGFETPNQGKIILNGKDVTFQAPNKRDMAMVFQSYALFPHMSVFENVVYGLRVRGDRKNDQQEKVGTALEMVGLSNLGERRPDELSGGQQQRVALARSLVMEPSLLLFDEPLSNLDAKLRVQMRSEILRLQRRLDVTSVYVTHDQVEAMALSDRIVVMKDGKVEQIGEPEEIYRRPVSRFVADFIGRANFISTSATDQQDDHLVVHLLGKELHFPARADIGLNQPLTAVVRPESLRLRENGNGNSVEVEQAMYLGSEVEYIVRNQEQSLVVVESDPRAHRIFEPGEQVHLEIIPEAVHLLPA